MSEIVFGEASIATELDKHGFIATTTSGVSMEPLFRTRRDVVIIKKADAELRKYDVALYTDRRGKYILHRVLKVKDDRYLIRGDNTYVMEQIPKQRVIGVLTEFNRKGKKHSCTDRSYRVYARLWHLIYPIRYVVYHVKRFFRRAFIKVFGRRKSK